MPERFETCTGLVESEIERGPIAADSTVRTILGEFAGRLDVPITIAFWEEPCGEGCQRAPVAALVVVRSPLAPGAS